MDRGKELFRGANLRPVQMDESKTRAKTIQFPGWVLDVA